MKRTRVNLWGPMIGLVLASLLPVCGGCQKGNVPNSNPDEIESAKFDAEKAENPTRLGSSTPPD